MGEDLVEVARKVAVLKAAADHLKGLMMYYCEHHYRFNSYESNPICYLENAVEIAIGIIEEKIEEGE